jgi:predicted NUDIX family NTP pyrophosphohydrolase
MNRISAGILLYRFIEKELQFFLVHPGGPFFKNKDLGHWTIPKGEPDESEDLPSCALREFREETGIAISGEMIELNPIQQKGGKKVFAWAMRGNLDPSKIESNLFELEWPYKSGKIQSFPEIDRAAWFSFEHSLEKINPAQQSLLHEAADILHQRL